MKKNVSVGDSANPRPQRERCADGTPRVLTDHPYATLHPPYAAAAFAALKAAIRRDGLRHSIHLYQGQILDGRHRYRACVEAGIEPTFVEFEGSEEDAWHFALTNNVERRNASPGAASMVRALTRDRANEAQHGGMRGADSPPLITVLDRAEASGVSETQQRNNEYVADRCRELAEAVIAGNLKPYAAYQKCKGIASTAKTKRQIC